VRPLSAQLVIEVWERGEGREPQLQVEELLAATQTQLPLEQLRTLSLGQRDGLLLRLREATLGPQLKGYVKCPQCDASLDFTLESADLYHEAPAAATGRLELGDLAVDYRLPTGADLAAAAGCPSLDEARDLLLARCVLKARRDGVDIAAAQLTEWEVGSLSARFEEADPQAELPLAMECEVCGHAWQPMFDIATFFWAEVAALAERLMGEVVSLARSFGWTEREILSMSAARRQRYLELAS